METWLGDQVAWVYSPKVPEGWDQVDDSAATNHGWPTHGTWKWIHQFLFLFYFIFKRHVKTKRQTLKVYDYH